VWTTVNNGQFPFITIGAMPSRLQNVTGKEPHFTKVTTMEKAHPTVLTGMELKSMKVALRLWFRFSKFNYQDETEPQINCKKGS